MGMKKFHPVIQEIGIWLRGRFSLTSEEKFWLLLFLIILWAGLLGRYLYMKNQDPKRLTPRQVETLIEPGAS